MKNHESSRLAGSGIARALAVILPLVILGCSEDKPSDKGRPVSDLHGTWLMTDGVAEQAELLGLTSLSKLDCRLEIKGDGTMVWSAQADGDDGTPQSQETKGTWKASKVGAGEKTEFTPDFYLTLTYTIERIEDIPEGATVLAQTKPISGSGDKPTAKIQMVWDARLRKDADLDKDILTFTKLFEGQPPRTVVQKYKRE